MELSRRQPSKACKRAEARNRQQFQNKQTSKEKSRGQQNPSRETLGGGGGILPVAISGRYLPGGVFTPFMVYTQIWLNLL